MWPGCDVARAASTVRSVFACRIVAAGLVFRWIAGGISKASGLAVHGRLLLGGGGGHGPRYSARRKPIHSDMRFRSKDKQLTFAFAAGIINARQQTGAANQKREESAR
jgi:hypothetical protein